MTTIDPITLLTAANPIPATEVAALAETPARDVIRAAIDRQRRPAVAVEAPRRPRRLVAIAVAAALVLAVPALAFSGILDSLFGFSNPGTVVSTGQLSLNDVQILEHDQVDVGAGIKLLATRDGIAFYASRTTDGRTCVLNGPAGGTAPTQIVIGTVCERDFPSAQQPLLGSYVLVRKPVAGRSNEAPNPSGRLLPDGVQTVGGLQGLAADGVATVEALDADGKVILQAPVIDNVYFARLDTTNLDITVPAAKIVALDADGNVIYSEQIPPPTFKTG